MSDGEFLLASRHWSGGLSLNIGERRLNLPMQDGQVAMHANSSATMSATMIEYSGADAVWSDVLSSVPTRFHNDLMANVAVAEGLSWQGDRTVHAQYYPAIMRAVEL